MHTGKMDKLHITFTPTEENGLAGESLWGEQVGDGRYRLANVPLANGYNLGDIVFVRKEHGVLEIQGISIRSGHSKLYAVGAKKGAAADARRKAVLDDLRELGCGIEGGGTYWILDLPPRVDRPLVEQRLDEAEAAALIEWFDEDDG